MEASPTYKAPVCCSPSRTKCFAASAQVKVQQAELTREEQLGNVLRKYWAAVKELKLSYYIGETLLFPIYTHYGNLI